jgi:hypothetical protein
MFLNSGRTRFRPGRLHILKGVKQPGYFSGGCMENQDRPVGPCILAALLTAVAIWAVMGPAPHEHHANSSGINLPGANNAKSSTTGADAGNS